MEEVKQKRSHRSVPKRGRRFDVSFRLRVVKLHVEDGFALEHVCQESGVSKSALSRWVTLYRSSGRAGLEDKRSHGKHIGKLPNAVSEKIVFLKKSDSSFGVRRISDLLRRWFCLPGSAESVRRILHEQGPAPQKPKHRRSNITRPRFFERATPNQMWQTDIFTFRMGGRYAYLIGFIDDYSRYMVGLGLYMSQTADNVIELYRRATAEYGVPKEMLTDNGRQYTSWRGTSKFEAELQKDKIHHIKSQPHHPMTLGKIERFWKTVYGEFLERAQFESFENAQERIRLWVKYYNHRRPHQGIGGMCPADRYFEIQHELRKTIESAIADNVLEMALRGKPKEPFYMVGRLEGQSVVLRAEKGKLRVTVDEQEQTKELEYDLTGGTDGEGKTNTEETSGETTISDKTHNTRCATAVSGSAVAVVGAQNVDGSLSRAVNFVDYIKSMAGTCTGGDASGTGAKSPAGERAGIESASSGTLTEEAGRTGTAVDRQTQDAPGTAAESPVCPITSERRVTDVSGPQGTGTRSCADHPASMQWENQHNGRGQTTPDISQDLLRVGEAGSCGTAAGAGGWKSGQTVRSNESAVANAGTAYKGSGEGTCGCKADDRSETTVGRIPTAAEAAARRYCFDN